MPANDHWISPRVARILILIWAINAGAILGDLFLGAIGGLIGAFAGFTIAIGKSHYKLKQ